MDTRDDFDSCQERWEYYQKRYPELKIQIKDIKNKNGRGVWKYGSVEISGDCFFNFNDKKIESFIKDIQYDPETKCAYWRVQNDIIQMKIAFLCQLLVE